MTPQSGCEVQCEISLYFKVFDNPTIRQQLTLAFNHIHLILFYDLVERLK